ncbi:MAG: hypothetical protein COA79_00605 [Planctomycetota bacterium]|nr:MAG: hypothetical protein COA79_00605 [Planctomycetota bacterium]
MIRFSLGISFTSNFAKCVCINLDDMTLEHSTKILLSSELSFPLNHLKTLDTIFSELQKEDFLGRVVSIRISAPETSAVLSNDIFFKNLMTFTAYAKSLVEHFKDSFVANSYVGYEENNYESWTSWSEQNTVDFNLPINALRFSLKNHFKRFSDETAKIENIQFLSSFVTSIIAGKKAPVDISCSWISGLQNPGNELNYDDKSFDEELNLNSSNLDSIKPFHESFSYVAPYFVEKYGVYREALILTAGGHQAAVAVGSGGKIYLDTDDFLNLGAIVKDDADFDESCNICGLASESRIQVAHSHFNQIFNYEDLKLPFDISWDKLVFDQTVEDYSLLHIKGKKLTLDKDLIINSPNFFYECYLLSYLLDIKHTFPDIKELIICGEGKNNINFMKMVANIFNCTVKYFEYGNYSAAIGNALGSARRFREEDYDFILNSFFDKHKVNEVLPDPKLVSEYLSHLFKYESLV